MTTSQEDPSRTPARETGRFPAYGSLEAALSYALFYVLVDRATPTVVTVLVEVLGDDAASLVRLGLAAFLWFVLVVTVLDQGRRQLATLGVVGAGSDDGMGVMDSIWTTAGPAACAGTLVVGAAVSTLTWSRALATVVALIEWVARLDVSAIVSVDVLVLVVFFIAYSAAVHCLDRLVVDGLRAAIEG